MYKAYSFFVISCVSSFMVYSICNNKNVVEESLIKQDYPNEQIIINEEIKEEIINFVEEEKELMIIEIPKIKLKEKIYNKNSKLNNIDKNIIIMNESNMPNDDGGVIIIGGHSGYGKTAYFKHLNMLKIGDEVILTYQNKNYYYKVVEYHLDPKNGSITINNINKKNKLFLFTCNPNDKNNYLVYSLELFK